jgi:hypothetical protein
MLFDVVNELDLSDGMIDKHGPHGTAPAIIVREVLEQKDRQIAMLRAGFVEIGQPSPLRTERDALAERCAALEKGLDALRTHTKWLRIVAERLHKQQRDYSIAKTCEEAADAIDALLPNKDTP